ncbi:MAG: sigma-70 family RNA polymerase sigma factor [Candidatus Poribacteria bacterium]
MRTEDGRIIQECLNGEPEAFGVLVDKYKQGIFAFVYAKLRNFQDAQDVTQEVFLKAYKDLHSLKRWESFAYWLYRIAYSRCAEFLRKNSKRIDLDFIEDQDSKIMDVPSLDYYREDQLSESVRDALDSLPQAYREVLMLHYFGGMNSNEIANALGASPTAIRMRMSRAREQLKEEIIAMMGTAFEGQKLRVGFTFRVVEAIKRVKIQPISPTKGLPWGLSLGAGLIFSILMLGQHIPFNLPDIAMGLPLPSDMKILKVGEIPVEAIKVSTMTFIGNKGDGKGIAPDPKGQENAFFMAPQGEGKWEKRADMPTARCAFDSAVVNGKIYAIGGRNNAGVISNVDEYDPMKDKWDIKSSMPQAKEFLCASSVNGKIYAFGGLNNNTLSSVHEYDPVLNKWTAKKDMPKGQFNYGVCALNSKIYVFGGEDDKGSNTMVYEFDPAKDSWTKKANSPTIRNSMSACSVNGKIYVIGGYDNIVGARLSTVEEYDPVADIWKKKSDMPTARQYPVACAVGTKIYALGGFNWGVTFATVEIYDTLTDTWTKGVDMQSPKWLLSSSVVDGKIYSIGGMNGANIFSAVEEFDPGFISKSVDPNGKLPKTWGTIKAK